MMLRTSCLDNVCPLSTTPACSKPHYPWITDNIHKVWMGLRAAERKWRKSREHNYLHNPSVSEFSSHLHLLKRYSIKKRLRMPDSWRLFSTFKNLLTPPPPPSITFLSADDFATFFIEKVAATSAQFLNPPKRVWPCLVVGALLNSYSLLSEKEISMLLLCVCPVLWTPFQQVPKSHHLTIGVPQGSLLGPHHFLRWDHLPMGSPITAMWMILNCTFPLQILTPLIMRNEREIHLLWISSVSHWKAYKNLTFNWSKFVLRKKFKFLTKYHVPQLSAPLYLILFTSSLCQ